jgi:protein-tyrosine phosphatase
LIDLHCHVLPGIDDGPATIEGSLALAGAAAAAGTRVLVATPHVSAHYFNDADTIARLVAKMNAAIACEGLELEVAPGAEVAATRVADLGDEELSRLGLGGGSWLLVECPLTTNVTGFDTIVRYLKDRGHRIVLAHPERSPVFQRDPQMLRALVQSGMLVSVTAGALVGQFGRDVQRYAQTLARDELIHNVASDAHDHVHRAPGITAALEVAGLQPLGEWLTQTVPAAILADAEIPPRPCTVRPAPVTRRRRWWPARG